MIKEILELVEEKNKPKPNGFTGQTKHLKNGELQMPHLTSGSKPYPDTKANAEPQTELVKDLSCQHRT